MKGYPLELQTKITRESLHILMRSFYEQAVLDDEIGHFFRDEIADDLEDEEWKHHIDLLADFWLHKLLGEDTYYGNFVGAHVKMTRIHKENYATWLALFSKTADEIYIPEVATEFKAKAAQLVKEFFTSTKKI